MRLAVLSSLALPSRRDTGPGFGIPHLMTVLLLFVTLPVFIIGAAVALPIGALVLSVELLRKALAAPARR